MVLLALRILPGDYFAALASRLPCMVAAATERQVRSVRSMSRGATRSARNPLGPTAQPRPLRLRLLPPQVRACQLLVVPSRQLLAAAYGIPSPAARRPQARHPTRVHAHGSSSLSWRAGFARTGVLLCFQGRAIQRGQDMHLARHMTDPIISLCYAGWEDSSLPGTDRLSAGNGHRRASTQAAPWGLGRRRGAFGSHHGDGPGRLLRDEE